MTLPCRCLTRMPKLCVRRWILLWPWPLIDSKPTSWLCTHLRPSTFFFSAGQHTELNSEILTLDGVAIEIIGLNCETKWFKFLGMRLDDKLSWEGQHAHVYQKAAAGTFMLACLKRTVPRRIRLMIYNSLVWPYFEYCIEVWGCSKASDLKVFFKLQKMCVRHISGAGYRSHTDPLFASNKI